MVEWQVLTFNTKNDILLKLVKIFERISYYDESNGGKVANEKMSPL